MIYLHNEIKNYISGKRYQHTVGVERECRKLAGLFGLNDADTDRLRIAALLHDITKEYSYDEHLDLLDAYGIEYDTDILQTPSIIHALTGAEFAKKEFSQIVDETVYNAIRWHTTGRDNMNTIDKLLILSDYTEESRKVKSCVKLRKYFYNKVNTGDPLKILDTTLIMAFDSTIKHLIKEGCIIDCQTVKSRNYLLMEKNKYE